LIRDLGICGQSELDILGAMIDKKINCVKSSSMGRVFDAASAVLGLRRVSTCEGEASMVLQFAAERFLETGGAASAAKAAAAECAAPDSAADVAAAKTAAAGPDVCLLRPDDGGGEFRIPAAGIIRELAERRLGGEDTDRLAFVFHRQAAAMIAAGCEEARRKSGLETVVLTGGVMQNLLLLDLTVPELERRGFRVLTHRMIPANDGGIGVGQALYALTHL
jgi:hydrogenase maturation protein HypF